MALSDDVAALQRRMDTLERNQADQARTLGAFTDELRSAGQRLDKHDEAHQERRVTDAGDAERTKALLSDVASMKADISSIKGTFAKALWIFVSAIIVAFATFIIRGGLAP